MNMAHKFKPGERVVISEGLRLDQASLVRDHGLAAVGILTDLYMRRSVLKVSQCYTYDDGRKFYYMHGHVIRFFEYLLCTAYKDDPHSIEIE